jgi:hypothetical protein
MVTGCFVGTGLDRQLLNKSEPTPQSSNQATQILRTRLDRVILQEKR